MCNHGARSVARVNNGDCLKRARPRPQLISTWKFGQIPFKFGQIPTFSKSPGNPGNPGNPAGNLEKSTKAAYCCSCVEDDVISHLLILLNIVALK
jgi:hypothetical protein